MQIGETIYYRGDEVTIIGKPENIYGGEFCKARHPDGRTVLVATAAQREKNYQENRRDRKLQQDGFRRLANI